MKICQVVPHVDEEASGPSYSVPRLSESLASNQHDVVLATLRSRSKRRSFENIQHIEFESTWPPRKLGISRQMKCWFDANAPGFAGLEYAAYGLALEFTGGHTVLWYFRAAYSGRLSSTFINANSYNTYAGLGLVCATGLLAALAFYAARSHLSSRERLLAVLEAIAGWRSLLPVAWCAPSAPIGQIELIAREGEWNR